MSLPIKPDVCVTDTGRVAVFLAGAYRFMPPTEAQALVRKLQSALAHLKRESRRASREAAVSSSADSECLS